MGQLPASTIGLGRSDSELAHRTGSLGRPPHDVLLPPPRVPAPANPLRKGIQSLRRGIKRVVGKVRILSTDKMLDLQCNKSYKIDIIVALKSILLHIYLAETTK